MEVIEIHVLADENERRCFAVVDRRKAILLTDKIGDGCIVPGTNFEWKFAFTCDAPRGFEILHLE
jgi:hypothetical protein